MKINNLNIEIPNILVQAYGQHLISSVIIFGSSLYSSEPKDMDIAIVSKYGCFDDLITLIVEDNSLSKYDISLIKEEEIDYNKKFYFGGHGQYLVESLRRGLVLLGDNVFKDYPAVSERDLKFSIFERMKEYIYVLRKSYFDKSYENKLYSRYNKILKLSVFLLTNEYSYPDLLSLNIDIIKGSLIKNGYLLSDDIKSNIENLWTIINEQYS